MGKCVTWAQGQQPVIKSMTEIGKKKLMEIAQIKIKEGTESGKDMKEEQNERKK